MRHATLTLVFAVTLLASASRADEAQDARRLFDKAMKAVEAKDFTSASTQLKEAVRLQPRNDSYLGNLGYVELMLGRCRAAVEYSEKAAALNDKNPYYFLNAANAAHRLGEHEKALKHSEKALSFGRAKLGAPMYAWMLTVRNGSRVGPLQDGARAAVKAKNYKEAVSLMKKAVEIVPNDPHLLAFLASLEFHTGEHAGGLAHAEKAIALEDKQGWFHAVAAIHARELADFEKGRRYARKALTFKPADLGAGNLQAMKELLESVQTRTYTIRFKLDPEKAWGEKGRGKGAFYIPLPSTDLPYQRATFTLHGALASTVEVRDGVRLLRIDADNKKPIHYTVTATVSLHDYRPRIQEKPASRYPDDVRPYLGASPAIDPDDKKIKALAAKLKGDEPAATVRNVLGWLKKNLTYRRRDFDTALEVIERGHGDCGGYSAVFVALCRAAGVPAHKVWGQTKLHVDGVKPGCMNGHVWAEVFVADAGWTPVEPQQLNGFGHMPLGYVRMLHRPPNSLGWPRAMTNAWSAMFHVGAYSPAYEEKLAEAK